MPTTALPHRALVQRRKNDRARKQKQREVERAKNIPDQRTIDRALAEGIRHLIEQRYGHMKQFPPDSEVYAILHHASTILHTSGYEIKAPKAKARIRLTLRK